ncbi:hypothetical protein RB597_003822 [Gaeumannomyces tritici]
MLLPAEACRFGLGDMVAGPLVVGVDVGGTNTDSVLLDLSKTGSAAVVAADKKETRANVTRGIRSTLGELLSKALVAPADVAAVAIGTTHFLNAIIERDGNRVEKVAVLRLASHNFSAGTPPFADWPQGLERIVHGFSAIIPGGCNIDGSVLGPVDEEAVRRLAAEIRTARIKNVAIVGIGSPMDEHHGQEEIVRDMIVDELGGSVNVVCSKEIGGAGLLARENATILNAAILSFARRTIQAFIGAMRNTGLRCPLYLTSNAGHLLPFSEAIKAPIHIFSSGPTNSIRGAAFLAGADGIGRTGSVVIDIGGTTTDVGYLLRNGYPRLTSTYSDLSGIKVNLEMPAVGSIGLGGGSVIHRSGDVVRVGPQSVGHELTTKALCFGGNTPTATDVAVSLGVEIGAAKRGQYPELPDSVAAAANLRIKKMLESIVDRARLSPDPCDVILVGGGSILCPPGLLDDRLVRSVAIPPYANVANAVGAATTLVHGSAESIIHGPEVEAGIATVTARAVQNAVARGGVPGSSATLISKGVSGVPYVEGQTVIKIEVALPADHGRVYAEMLHTPAEKYDEAMEAELTQSTDKACAVGRSIGEEQDGPVVDLGSYRPDVSPDGEWRLSETDVKLLSVGCYILGSGGGGSTYAPELELRQLIRSGHSVKITRCEDLIDDDLLPPVGSVGTPAVGIERPGGDGVYHAMKEMEKVLGIGARFTKLLAIEIGGSNGVGTLLWGSSKYYNIPTVDGDLMGRAYPNFEMVSRYVMGDSVNDLFPVTLCSGTGDNVVIPKGQDDAVAAGAAMRDNLVSMGSAAGAVGNPLTGAHMKSVGIPNTFSLAWRLGRAVVAAQRRAESFSGVARAIIAECGGPRSCRLLFRGKVRGVESHVTATAHSTGKITIERLGEGEGEDEVDDGDTKPASDKDTSGIEFDPDLLEVEVPFINENLSVVGRTADCPDKVLATVPDLIFILDTATGENIGVQDYQYGLKVAVMIMAPHPLWVSERGLQVAGPRAFGLVHDYTATLEYTKPRSVIEEFRSVEHNHDHDAARPEP